MKALPMIVGKVTGQGCASRGVGDGPGASTFSVEESGVGWKQSLQRFHLPCSSESVGQRVRAGLRARGFQVSFWGWAQGKAGFRLTTLLWRVVGKWLGLIFLEIPSRFKCLSRTEGHCIKTGLGSFSH